MNTDEIDHYISILAIKDSLIEKLHDRIGELEANLKARIGYEEELVEKLEEAEYQLNLRFEE